MLWTANDLHGWSIHATDGTIGRVEDFFFDQEKWAVRFLVVDTGGWLAGRKVLISPIALDSVNAEHGDVHVKLTREEVRESPELDPQRPISREEEERHFRFFGWPFYWSGAGLWGVANYPGLVVPVPMPDHTSAELPADAVPEPYQAPVDDPLLRSMRATNGYTVTARDGEIGSVVDFVIEEGTWAVRYLAVGTSRWLPAKKVLLPPHCLIGIDWVEQRVAVDLDKEVIDSSPEWVPAYGVDRKLEQDLYRHYGWSPYWEEPLRAAA